MTIRLLLILLCCSTIGMAQEPLSFFDFYRGLNVKDKITFMRIEYYAIQNQQKKQINAREYTLNQEKRHIGILEYTPEGRVISMDIKKYQKDGCLIEETFNNEEVYYEWYYVYSDDGCLLEEKCECNFEPYSCRKYTYNKKFLIEETENQSHKQVEKICYTYYADGQKKSKEVFDYYLNRTLYIYDEQGREIEIIQYGEKNVERGHIYKKYAGGLLCEEKTQDDVKLYQYDSYNNKIEIKALDEETGKMSIINYFYQYDKRGNWISRLETRDGDPFSYTERKITYMEKNEI